MKWGGDLISIHNNAETALIQRLVGNTKEHYWIGMHDIRREGTYQWMDNTRTNYYSWDGKKKQPNGGDCVAIKADGTLWHDGNCMQKLKFICKKARFDQGTRPTVIDIPEEKPKKIVRDNGIFNLLDSNKDDELVIDEVFGMFQ